MDDDVRWRAWCDDYDAALEELHALFHTRWMWRVILELLKTPEMQAPVVQNYFLRTYVATVCTAIRREADRDSRTTSLARCLQALIDCPHFASRERWARMARERPGAVLTEGDIEQGFSTFAGADERFISTAIVAEDLATLQAAATPVRKYTNTVIAHRQRKSGGTIRETVTFGEINEALETVGRVARKYYRLRQPGVELAMLTPVVEYGFLTMFKEPWYRDGLDLPSDQDEG